MASCRVKTIGRRMGFLARSIGKEALDFRCAHRRRMPLAVEANEAFNPIDVRLLGADAVVAKADTIANPVEETRLRRCFEV
jgi:hypothetical protein